MTMYHFQISEPWDFASSDGSNLLLGKVIREIDSEHFLFEANEAVSLKSIRGRFWILSTRYVGQHIGDLSYYGTVNGGLLSEKPLPSETLDEIMNKAVFAAIGSIAPAVS